jgi:hypothetical protein
MRSPDRFLRSGFVAYTLSRYFLHITIDLVRNHSMTLSIGYIRLWAIMIELGIPVPLLSSFSISLG